VQVCKCLCFFGGVCLICGEGQKDNLAPLFFIGGGERSPPGSTTLSRPDLQLDLGIDKVGIKNVKMEEWKGVKGHSNHVH